MSWEVTKLFDLVIYGPDDEFNFNIERWRFFSINCCLGKLLSSRFINKSRREVTIHRNSSFVVSFQDAATRKLNRRRFSFRFTSRVYFLFLSYYRDDFTRLLLTTLLFLWLLLTCVREETMLKTLYDELRKSRDWGERITRKHSFLGPSMCWIENVW